MTTNLALLGGGQLGAAALRAHGLEMAFSIAGESYLEVPGALEAVPRDRREQVEKLGDRLRSDRDVDSRR